jgi:ferredoxin
MKRPVVELGDCSLCEGCVEMCPRIFSINDAGYIEVADLPEYPEAEIDEAIKYCPAHCIAWSEK